MMDDKVAKVTDRMRCLCSRREYCKADIFKKACDALDGDKEAADGVLRILIEEKYVDEMRYASAFARDKSGISGWGVIKIRHALSAKGIPKSIIAQAVEEIDTERATSRMEKLMENKYRSLKEDPQCRLKLLRFGMGRGYEYDAVLSEVDRLMKK